MIDSILPLSARVGAEQTINNKAELISVVWADKDKGYYRARYCKLVTAKGFYAETLVIYPCVGSNLPVFGAEYISAGNRVFGAIDFHPINRNLDPIQDYLYTEPDREINSSHHYDLDLYFSPKLWFKRGCELEEFEQVCGERVCVFLEMLQHNLDQPLLIYPHGGYNDYMAQHDPARGILRAHYGEDFAETYIREFLFKSQDC